MIRDWLKEHKITNEYEIELDAATKMFLQQRNSLREIYDTSGYKEIVRYWTSQKEAALKVLLASKENRDEARAAYDAADKFLKFLENIVKINE